MIAAFRATFESVTRNWPWAALAVCIAALGSVHAIETFQHIRPCHLCLIQRQAYWIAGGVALAGAALGCTRWSTQTYRLVCALLAAAFLYGLYWAAFHAGGEYGWWALPASCDVDPNPTAVTAEDIRKLLNNTLVQPVVACGRPAWWFPHIGAFKGLTMAGWNALLSAVLVGWSGYAALRSPKAAS